MLRVPLSVDIEAGYSHEPTAVAELVARLMDEGVVGINLEDGTHAPELLSAKIEAVKTMAALGDADVFINARTDVYLRGMAKGEAAADEVIGRATMYRVAGCDGIFVPGLTDHDAIAKIASAMPSLPLDLMQVPGLAPVCALYALGVRRISVGSKLAQAALGHLRGRVEHYLAGDLGEVFTHPTSDYATTNKLFVQSN